MAVQLIGVDCATEEARTGIAVGTWEDGRLRVSYGFRCHGERSVRETILGECEGSERPILIALDAPLGWPLALAESLVHHRAGDVLEAPPNTMFSRETDRFVQARLGKKPLEVGADRIARTAHAALRLLGAVRASLGLEIPLAWYPGQLPAHVSAIEVYPAATLVSRGIEARGYKRSEAISQRKRIIEALRADRTIFPDAMDNFESSADVLDAAICLVAAADFMDGSVVPPVDRERAEREGWIWVRPPKTMVGEA